MSTHTSNRECRCDTQEVPRGGENHRCPISALSRRPLGNFDSVLVRVMISSTRETSGSCMAVVGLVRPRLACGDGRAPSLPLLLFLSLHPPHHLDLRVPSSMSLVSLARKQQLATCSEVGRRATLSHSVVLSDDERHVAGRRGRRFWHVT